MYLEVHQGSVPRHRLRRMRTKRDHRPTPFRRVTVGPNGVFIFKRRALDLGAVAVLIEEAACALLAQHDQRVKC